MKKLRIALVGNTNVGKTTLLNTICGLNKETSNFPGTTVELCKCKISHKNIEYEFTDLPGAYSLTSFSDEEKVTRDILLSEKFDFIVQVLEPTSKKRSLVFTLELMELDIPIFLCINNKNNEKAGIDGFLQEIENLLGISGVIVTAQDKGAKDKLLDTIKHKAITTKGYRNTLLEVHKNFRELIDSIGTQFNIKSMWLAIKVLEKDESIIKTNIKKDDESKLNKLFTRDFRMNVRRNRFNFLEDNISFFIRQKSTKHKKADNNICPFYYSDKIDKFLLCKWISTPIFLIIMWGVFEATFTLGAYPMDAMASSLLWLQEVLKNVFDAGLLSSLVIDGVLGGVGATFIFIPQIIILFFFISIMNQTGYLARTGYILDNVMKKIGLPGKSFIPLLMGFGCNVPAIMATRTLSGRKERLITSMMIPFMSCSAKLPIYTLFIAALVDVKYRGSVMFSLYIFGILFGVFTGVVLNKITKNKVRSLILELPRYTLPSIKSLWFSTWGPTKEFLDKAIKVVLPFSVIIWMLFTFPQVNGESVAIEDTYAAKVGHSVEFIFKPLGFDWRVSTAVISGLAAKEVFVSTLGTLYSLEGEDDTGLLIKIQEDSIFTPAMVVSLLVFMLLYAPCIAVFAVFRQEFGIRWAIISFVYPTVLAWVVAFVMYRVGLAIL